MKILAVIPARAGSKGIPNKNIRIIGGHPLVYYAIHNAQKSRHITDVVVTTDSAKVRLIADRMGVACRWRDPALCGDDVTLDAVVADAIPSDETWDYIVTMQPTSPTLTADTLDQAIAYALENGLDTLISAINAPHLSWREEQGKKVPDYAVRLNRQYLPPHYLETGAFVIARAAVVTPKTRIGEKVDVFEVPEREAQDVDTFADLQTVAQLLETPRVAIYVNGNNQRGMGHIYRALEVADEFYTKPDIIYDKNQTDVSVFGETTHTLIAADGVDELFARCKREQYTIFINDILTTSADYMNGLRSALPKAKIINFEDDGEGMRKADLVFNSLYKESGMPHVYSGEKYYIVGKPFLFFEPIPIRDEVTKVFISFGGADPRNYSDRLLKIITKPEYEAWQFVVVLGRAKKNVDELMKYNRYPHIKVMYDVENMPEIMSECDVAVTSRGRTGYELAVLGIPSIAMAQNEREEKHEFINYKNGFTYIGLDPDDEVMEGTLWMYIHLKKESRQHFQQKMLCHDLRNGRKRVMGLIQNS